uniref:RHS repeat domain-containing protein n=1 Tax=Treponema pedis TaxID=409322 RepID=UPI000570D8A7
KLPFRFTGKELDEETGLYYYGARYLDPKYSRWLSGDPALSDYIPKAPIDDDAKKHNENLPGMGGVFNVVNLHVYHYAGNNPVKYVDPDGMAIVIDDATIIAIGTGILLTAGIISIANSRPYKEAVSEVSSYVQEKIDEASEKIANGAKQAGTWIGEKVKSAWDNIFQSKKHKKKSKTKEEKTTEGEYKIPKKGSGKEKSSDIPSWAKGKRPQKGESGKDFAKRLMDERYGEGNYDPRQDAEFSKIKKWGDRGFE